MDEILCPECGELNPAENDFCQRCQAPLDPSLAEALAPDSGSTHPHPEPQPAEDAFPDWLSELLDSSDAEKTPAEPEDEPRAQPPELQPELEIHPGQLAVETSIPADPDTAEPEPQAMQAAPLSQDDTEETEQPLEEMDYYQSWLRDEETAAVPPEDAEDASSEKPDAPPPPEAPEWLKAMQAGGSLDGQGAQTGTTGAGGELAGPLAGLVGALPAEPDIIQTFRPTTFTMRLRATDAQQTNAALLRQIIQAEGKPKSVAAAPVRRSQKLLRVMVALVMFASVLYSLLTGHTALSTSLTGDTPQVANQLVESLPLDKPLLVVVDYSPAYTSEIGTSLSAVLGRLLLRGGYPVFLSTNPTGPIQIQNLLERLVSQLGIPQLPAHTNLGFLAGQAMGIQAFAKDPPQTMPFEILSEPAWQTTQLRGIKKIADFGLVIVATENPETAVNWIEQARPQMGAAPLLMLVSAQIEPVIRPYYDASPRQVQGIIVGLANAVQYETMSGQTWTAHSLWSPVMFSLSIAVLLVLLMLFFDSLAIIKPKSHIKPLKARKEARK